MMQDLLFGNKNEHLEQKEFVEQFRSLYPGIFIYAIPNGSIGNKPGRIHYFYAEGMRPGIPDLHIPQWSLFVEMKARHGTLKESQVATISELLSIGQNVIVAYGSKDAILKIEKFLKSGEKTGYNDLIKPRGNR